MIQRNFQHVRYLSMAATGALAELADGFWQLENCSDQAQQFTVLPDGFFKVVLRLESGAAPRLLLSGLRRQPHVIGVAGGGRVVGIRFKLLAAELFARPLPLDAVVPLPADYWLLPALAAPSLPEIARRTTDLLAAWQPEPAKRALFAALYRGEGRWPVAQVAAAAGWSARQINRYFQQQFGLPLKAYSDQLRAYAAARQLRPAELFPQGDYCDQSHGIRQLRKYTGHTPRQLARQQLDRFIQLCPPVAPELCKR